MRTPCAEGQEGESATSLGGTGITHESPPQCGNVLNNNGCSRCLRASVVSVVVLNLSNNQLGSLPPGSVKK